MKDIPTIIDDFGGPTAFAAAIGTTQQNASNMKDRQSIPPRFWSALVAAARERGIDGVTLDTLAQLAAARPLRSPTPETGAAA